LSGDGLDSLNTLLSDMANDEKEVRTSYMEIVMGDVSSVLVVRRGVTKSGKVMGRIGMDVFAISAGLEVTSILLFG
jgi:hypothetical protein